MTLVDAMTGEKVTGKLPIDAIVIGNRHRNAFGDVEALAASIKEIGLINPVTVTTKNQLVAGHRRIEACRLLGVKEIPVRYVRSIDSAAKILQAERDENVCRKDMTPAELKSLTDALLEIERPKADERMKAGVANPRTRGSQGSDDVSKEKGKASSKAAEAAGWSRNSYERTKRVLDSVNDPTLPESVRATAAELAAGLEDGSVTPRRAADLLRRARVAAGVASANERVTTAAEDNPVEAVNPKSRAGVAARVAKAKEMAAAGATSRQIAAAVGVAIENMAEWRRRHGVEVPADAVVGRPRRIDADRVVSETVFSLEASVMAIDLIALDQLDRSQIEGWANSLDSSLKFLNKFHKQLKELALDHQQ